jgi:hypothetical protein
MNERLKNFERELDCVLSRLAKKLVVGLAKSGVTGVDITTAAWTADRAILVRADVTSTNDVSSEQLLGIVTSYGRPVSAKGSGAKHSWAMTRLMLDDYPGLKTALALDALAGATPADVNGGITARRQFRVNEAQTHMTMVGGARVTTFVINPPTLI